MTRKAQPKTLLGRRLKDGDFPFVIRRKAWASLLSAVMSPALAAIAGAMIWLLLNSVVPLDLGAIFMLLMAALLLIGSFIMLDAIGYTATVDRESITIKGLILTRRFAWSEITHFGTWRIRGFADGILISLGYQAVIHVDGSNHPRRLLQNLFFAGHFMPPFMELGGKELIRLLAKSGEHLGWREVPR